MKHKLTGIVSGILLVGVLVGNFIITAISIPETVTTQAKAQQGVSLPVLMYHHLLKDSSRWGKYVLSPKQFEEDLKYIRKEGYTTVSVEQVIAFYDKGIPLPPKPIMITFDDGHETVHEYAFPLLKKYKMCAVINIIGKYTDLYSTNISKSLSYAYVTWEQLNNMEKSGVFEIGNHSYDLHTVNSKCTGVIKKVRGRDITDQQMIKSDIASLNQGIKESVGVDCNIFSYPFGKYNDETNELLYKMGFRVAFSCAEKVNVLNPSKDKAKQIIKLSRYNRPSGITSETMFKKFK